MAALIAVNYIVTPNLTLSEHMQSLANATPTVFTGRITLKGNFSIRLDTSKTHFPSLHMGVKFASIDVQRLISSTQLHTVSSAQLENPNIVPLKLGFISYFA